MTYEIAVTTQEYCEKTTEQGFTNVSHTYDVATDSCYATKNGGWYLNTSDRWKYFLEPNTLYTIMDDTTFSTLDGKITYTGGDMSGLGSGYDSNGYYFCFKTKDTGNMGFYFNWEKLPRNTHPIVIKGEYHECIPRDTIYANLVSGDISSTIAKLYTDGSLQTKGELIEGQTLSFQANGDLHAHELIEGESRINGQTIYVTEFIEGGI